MENRVWLHTWSQKSKGRGLRIQDTGTGTGQEESVQDAEWPSMVAPVREGPYAFALAHHPGCEASVLYEYPSVH